MMEASKFIRNVGTLLPHCTASHLKKH